MKFYGITMQGKFVNQTVAVVPPTFDHDVDTGRLIYNADDGFLWWGDGENDVWKSIGEGGIELGEAEDMYSDLLRTSVFLNCTWGDFASNMVQDIFIDEGASDSILSDNWDANLGAYVFTAAGQVLVSNPIMFDDHVNLAEVLYCMASCYWIDDHPHNYSPVIEVDAGGGWEPVINNDVHKFAIPGKVLRIRVTSSGPGMLMSWGLYYNKDLSTDCSKYALTQREFNITTDTTVLNVQYQPGFALVYLNGILLQDGNDYTADDGENIIFSSPALVDGDVVLVISFGTTAMLDPAEEANLYIRKDATVPWNGSVEQSVGGSKFINLGDGTDDGDSVNIGQLDETDNTYTVNRHSRLYNDAKTILLVDTEHDQVDVHGIKIVDVGAGTIESAGTDAINAGQLFDHSCVTRLPALSLKNLGPSPGAPPYDIPGGFDTTWTWDMANDIEFSARIPPAGFQGALVRVFIENDATSSYTGEAFSITAYVNGEEVAQCSQSVVTADNSNALDLFALPNGDDLSFRIRVTVSVPDVGGEDDKINCTARFSHIGWYR